MLVGEKKGEKTTDDRGHITEPHQSPHPRTFNFFSFVSIRGKLQFLLLHKSML
jgi:hypothetical protein